MSCIVPEPSDICVQQLYQKLCTIVCQDPLESAYSICTRNYILYSARTLWQLCTTTVPETMYRAVPGPTDMCVQQLYQKLHTVQCQDPLASVYKSCTRNYIPYNVRTLWQLCTTAVPETMYHAVPGPTDVCVQQLYPVLIVHIMHAFPLVTHFLPKCTCLWNWSFHTSRE